MASLTSFHKFYCHSDDWHPNVLQQTTEAPHLAIHWKHISKCHRLPKRLLGLQQGLYRNLQLTARLSRSPSPDRPVTKVLSKGTMFAGKRQVTFGLYLSSRAGNVRRHGSRVTTRPWKWVARKSFALLTVAGSACSSEIFATSSHNQESRTSDPNAPPCLA